MEFMSADCGFVLIWPISKPKGVRGVTVVVNGQASQV
jgi:hypothetical protein